MTGGSNGYGAALVRQQLMPGLISSLPATAGLPPFISFSTSYPKLGAAVRTNFKAEHLPVVWSRVAYRARLFPLERWVSRSPIFSSWPAA
jgi:hypothetical protein